MPCAMNVVRRPKDEANCLVEYRVIFMANFRLYDLLTYIHWTKLLLLKRLVINYLNT